jgi:TolB-like protein
MTRLIVLPFRMLRPDADIEFLAFSLSDALTTSLSGLESLLVRSSLTAAQFGHEPLDLETLARKADVDAVLTGSLLRADDQLRVTAQLVEVPAGTVQWSHSMDLQLGDIFKLQDALTTRIVESLAVPLSARDKQVLAQDVPATAKAYEFYLRANQLAYEAQNWPVARDLYRQCLQEDPRYAPAWARLARLHRLIGMYSLDSAGDTYSLAEDAFKQALTLNPDLSLAHHLYTAVELETGHARDAMRRLLQRARMRSSDPEIFAGLVQACRYAGLQHPAITAHEHARRLDPHIKTAVAHAYMMTGAYDKAIAADEDDPALVTLLSLELMGDSAKALAHAHEQSTPKLPPLLRLFMRLQIAALEGRWDEGNATADELVAKWRLRDPCGTYYAARTLARLGHSQALTMFKRAVDSGFHCYPFFARDPWLDPLRSTAEFAAIARTAEAGYRDAVGTFVDAGGEQLLGTVQAS